MVTASLRDIADVRFMEAGNGLEAIEKLALTAVALVILDLNMPDMHGLEVLTFLRGHQRYRTVPVLVVTTRGDEASRAAAMAAGATAYMTKPFVPRLLASQAHALLEATRTSVQA